MARAVCPDCDGCVIITPTGEKQREGFSAEWWKITDHPNEKLTEVRGGIIIETPCVGSGKKV